MTPDNNDFNLINDEFKRLSELVSGSDRLHNSLNLNNNYFHVFKQELPY